MLRFSSNLNILIAALAVLALTSCAAYRITGKNKKNQDTTDDGSNLDDGKGIIFNITADPQSTDLGRIINFSAECVNTTTGVTGSVTWDFGDNQIAEGFSAAHSYRTRGTFEAKAMCEMPGISPMTKSLTITIGNGGTNNPNQNPCGCNCSCW